MNKTNVERVIILGNGFDINDRLETKFKNFGEYCYYYSEVAVTTYMESLTGKPELDDDHKEIIDDVLWGDIEHQLSENVEERAEVYSEFLEKEWPIDTANDNEGDFIYANKTKIAMMEIELETEEILVAAILDKAIIQWIKNIDLTKRVLNFWIKDFKEFDRYITFNYTYDWIDKYGIDSSKVTFVHGGVGPKEKEARNTPRCGTTTPPVLGDDFAVMSSGENGEDSRSAYDIIDEFDKTNQKVLKEIHLKEEKDIEIHLFGLSLSGEDMIYFKLAIENLNIIKWVIYVSKKVKELDDESTNNGGGIIKSLFKNIKELYASSNKSFENTNIECSYEGIDKQNKN